MIRAVAWRCALLGALATPALLAAERCTLAVGPADAARTVAPALADAVSPRHTPAAIVTALGPAQIADQSGTRQVLEWFLDDGRGLRIEFENPCRPSAVFRREAVHSARRALLRARAGLWSVPQSQVEALNAGVAAQGLQHNYGGPPSFYYDGETLTLGLTPFFSYQSMAANRPPDDIYCLATKWAGDELYMLTPESPRWVAHLTFRDGAFEETSQPPDTRVGIIIWRYERIAAEQGGIFERSLLAPRGRWSYGLGRELDTLPCHR